MRNITSATISRLRLFSVFDSSRATHLQSHQRKPHQFEEQALSNRRSHDHRNQKPGTLCGRIDRASIVIKSLKKKNQKHNNSTPRLSIEKMQRRTKHPPISPLIGIEDNLERDRHALGRPQTPFQVCEKAQP
jgi:hypothetical protein